MTELSEVFWTFLISSCVGVVLALGRMAYKSKCKEVNLCCLKIIRDTELESNDIEINTPNNILRNNSL